MNRETMTYYLKSFIFFSTSTPQIKIRIQNRNIYEKQNRNRTTSKHNRNKIDTSDKKAGVKINKWERNKKTPNQHNASLITTVRMPYQYFCTVIYLKDPKLKNL